MKESALDDKLGQEITLKGIARDAKGGAVLLTEEKIPVYIEGLDSWTSSVEGSRVSVSGVLKKEKYIPDPTIGEDGGISQGAVGMQYVLINSENKNDNSE